jgi:alpha-ketoglutarate-dependent taurine dioxygenase
VDIAVPGRLTFAEREALLARCAVANMALYASPTGSDPDKDIPRQLGRQLGLVNLDANRLADDDGISPLAVAPAGTRTEFIPYTDRGIRWHTDGYYNTLDRQVRGLLLHCVQRAESGGENRLMDHEIAYILLRDENPDHIRAFMAPDAMTIPPRLEDGAIARAAQAGPVFSVYPDGFLHMRYTARTVSIEWKADAATRAAVAALERILADEASPYIFRGRLEPGMGLVCNNVLHDRSAFADSDARKRLLYRARYFDRIVD